MIDISLWYLFPIGVAVATLAMSSGVSGSNFTVPLFVLWLGLPPKVAFWLALLSMMFGFSSGAIRNYRARTIEWYLVGRYSALAAPFGVLGAMLSTFAPQALLLFAFAGFILCYGIYLLVQRLRSANATAANSKQVVHDDIYWSGSAIAGFLHGLIATGMGKFMVAVCLNHRRCTTPAIAVGTSVVTVLIVSTCTFIARINDDLLAVLFADSGRVIAIAVWLIPGVLVGGQIGPRVAMRLSREKLQVYVAVLLIAVAVLTFLRVATMSKA